MFPGKLTEGPEGRSQFESLVKQSLAQLEAGISSFESVADSGNLALLLTNTGRLMRLCAHALTPENRTPLEGQERTYYNKVRQKISFRSLLWWGLEEPYTKT